jgi:Dynein light intermediate chain (DLIC)
MKERKVCLSLGGRAPHSLTTQSPHTDILARLSVYTVPSSSPPYTALLSHFLRPQSALPHTAVIIVLDWTRPWTFLEDLYTWLTWIEHWVQGDGARELEVIREEHRERCASVSSWFRKVLTIAPRRAGPPPALY